MSRSPSPPPPIDYDRPVSPAAASTDVYRRTVPGINDILTGARTSRAQSPPPLPRYDLTAGQYDEPLSAPVAVPAADEPSRRAAARNVVHTAPAYTQPHQQYAQEPVPQYALQQQQATQIPVHAQPQWGAPAGYASVASSTSSSDEPPAWAEELQEDVASARRALHRANETLDDVRQRVHAAHVRADQRLTDMASQVRQSEQDQTLVLHILLGIAIVSVVLLIVVTVYTTLLPFLRAQRDKKKTRIEKHYYNEPPPPPPRYRVPPAQPAAPPAAGAAVAGAEETTSGYALPGVSSGSAADKSATWTTAARQ